jgi:hypothetical protein
MLGFCCGRMACHRVSRPFPGCGQRSDSVPLNPYRIILGSFAPPLKLVEEAADISWCLERVGGTDEVCVPYTVGLFLEIQAVNLNR